MTAAVLLVGVIVTLFGAYCALRSVHRRPKCTEDGLPPDRVVDDTVYRAFRIPATATVEAFTDALDLTLAEAASWDPKTEPTPPAIRARQQERYRNWLRARKGRPSRVQGLDDGEAPKLTARPARVRPVSPITTASKRVQLPGTQPRRRSRPPLKTVGHYPLGGVRPMPNFIIGDAPGVERRCSCGAHFQGSADDVAERWQAHLHADERTFGSKAADRVFAWLEKRQERVEGRAASVNKARSLLKATSLLSVLFFLALSIDAGRGGRWNHDFKDPLIRSIAEAARSVGATGSTITAAAGGGNWSAGGSWVGGVQPTAADDVLLTLTSGSITVDSGSAACRSLDCTGYTATLSIASGGNQLNVGNASGGSVKFVAGMTLTAGGTIAFVATTASTTYTLTSAGKVVPNLTINTGTTTTIQFADAVTATGESITLTQGKLDTNSMSVNCGIFSASNSNTRTLTMGNSSIILTSSAVSFTAAVKTNLTVTANTATITQTGASAQFQGGDGGLNWNGLTVQQTAGSVAVLALSGGTMTLAAYTRTGTAARTDGLSLTGNVTVTGAFTVGGNTTQGINRVLVQSGTTGTQRTITVGSVVINGDVNFQDIAITYSGGASWTNSGAAYVGDAVGNNSTITTNATAAGTFYYKSAANANYSTVGNWFTATNGGGSAGRVPLPQDTVFIDANSGANTKTIDMPQLGGSIDFTGFTGTAAFSSVGAFLYGSLTWGSGMTITGTFTLSLLGRGSYTMTSNGRSATMAMTFAAPTGTYTLNDAFTISSPAASLSITSGGTFTANNFSVTVGSVAISNLAAITVNCGTGTWSLTATASTTVWNPNGTGPTINASNATFVISAASNVNRVFAGAAKSYGTLTYTVANSPGNLAITNAPNTFNTINIGPGRSWTVTALNTQNVTNLNANGSANGYLYLPGVSGNNATTPNTAALQLAGDVEFRVRLAMDSWTGPSAADAIFVAKDDATNREYHFRMGANTKRMQWGWWDSGGTFHSLVASANVPFADGSVGWVRVTFAVGTGTATFYTSTDATNDPSAVTWTTLGAAQVFGATSVRAQTALVGIGSDSTGTGRLLTGKFYRVRQYASIGGTVAFDADFTTKKLLANTFTEGSANAATVTINGTLAQQGDGRVTFSSGTPASQATLATTAGADLIGNVIQDISATPSKAVYALDSTDGGNNSGIFFMPPDVTPQDRQPALGRTLVGAVRRAARW